MDAERALAYQLRVAVIILGDAASSIRHLPAEQHGVWMSRLASSLVSLLELQNDLYAHRPGLDPRKGAESWESSDHAPGHGRVASALAEAYLLAAEGRQDEAVSLLSERLSHESSEFHQQWLRFEISQLRSASAP